MLLFLSRIISLVIRKNDNINVRWYEFIFYFFLLLYEVIFFASVSSAIQDYMSGNFLIFIMIGFMILDVCVMVILNRISSARESEQKLCLMQQQENLQLQMYQELQKKYTETCKVAHDINRHVSSLKALMETDDSSDKAQKYLSELAEESNRLYPSIKNLNPMLEIILNTTNAKCLSNNIEFSMSIEDFEMSFISDMDITTIFSNLLDNAIDACREIDKSRRKIRIIMRAQMGLIQKNYSTDTLPIKKKVNKGEKNQYLISNSHEPIIPESDFNKVQHILKERESVFYKESQNKSVFSSIIKCGECGASYKKKINRGKIYYVCIDHDTSSDYCSQKGITETCIKQAFVSMSNKLILHHKEILLPLRRSLQELNLRRFSGNAKIIDIHKNIADIKEQRHVISRLRKKGFMDEKKYNEKLTELESQLARHERELKKTAKADNEDNTLEQLDILIDSIEKQSHIITEFDEELFGIIVERIIVRDKSLEFILISGLSLKEDI